ncbi:MAG: hypothetical protein J2P46_11745, partial [Zavarzinella sp.]|nr:hypothetical protein [Zavarzinella sp.]
MSCVHPRRPVRLALYSFEDRTVPSTTVPVNPSTFLTDRVLVKVTGKHTPRSPLMTGAQALGNGLFAVDLKSQVTLNRALASFRHQAGVTFAEPDYVVQADNTPNDPRFGSQWDLNNASD